MAGLRWCLCGWLFFAGLVFAPGALSQPLTAQELAWIAANRTIPYMFVTSWPLDYQQGDEHIGLSREYLDHLEKKTGLRFVVSDGSRSPMLISSVSPSLLSDKEKQRWRFTPNWSASNALIVSGNSSTNIRSLEKLKGRRVAVRADTFYESWLREYHPEINLLSVAHTLDVFDAVIDGRADVGLGSDLVIRPLFNRYYSHQLSIAGQIPEMAAGIAMGVTPEHPELLSILHKSLANISARDSQAIFERWVKELKLGSPTFGVIVSHYHWQIALFIALVCSLILALRRAVLMKRKAIASESRKTEFLAMMSHEIRTPMNALIAALELLRLPVSEKRRQGYIELAFSSSQSMLALLNDILDHSKLSQQSMALELSRFSLRALVDSVCEGQRPAAGQKGLLLESLIDEPWRSMWVETDALRLRQIINNLLSNAIKFTATGSVTLSIGGECFRDHTCMLSVAVKDTGIGIPARAQAKLFDAWTQVDNSLARRYDGSGLGLYICRELAVLMRGAISCRSKPGQGTTFTLRIPVRQCAEVDATQDVHADLPRFVGGTSVLVVEDHPANQQMLGEQLRVLGCEVSLAEDGQSALNLLEEENYYDVILLDCNLPDQDGYSVAAAIRAREQVLSAPPVPIVAISAMNDTEHHLRCKTSGMDAVLSKPVCLSGLAQVLANWCRVDLTASALVPAQIQGGEQLENWLLQDMDGFSRAGERRDRAAMLHHIHRLRGVSAMYQLGELMTLAEKIEQALRAEQRQDDGDCLAWCEQLRQAVNAAVPL